MLTNPAAALPHSTLKAKTESTLRTAAVTNVAGSTAIMPSSTIEDTLNASEHAVALDLEVISLVLNTGFRALLKEASRLGVLEPPYGRTPVPDPKKITEDRYDGSSDEQEEGGEERFSLPEQIQELAKKTDGSAGLSLACMCICVCGEKMRFFLHTLRLHCHVDYEIIVSRKPSDPPQRIYPSTSRNWTLFSVLCVWGYKNTTSIRFHCWREWLCDTSLQPLSSILLLRDHRLRWWRVYFSCT